MIVQEFCIKCYIDDKSKDLWHRTKTKNLENIEHNLSTCTGFYIFYCTEKLQNCNKTLTWNLALKTLNV